MRVLIGFLLIALSNTLLAQSNQDSITLIKNKASGYLTKMYSEQNFEFASKMWDTKMFAESQDIYKKAGVGILKDSSLFNQIKNHYTKYYSTSSGFTILNFAPISFEKENDELVCYVSYTFSEKMKDENVNSYSMLLFLFDKSSSDWKVLDFKTLAILHSFVDKD